MNCLLFKSMAGCVFSGNSNTSIILTVLILLTVGGCSAWREQRMAQRAEPLPPMVIETSYDGRGISLTVNFEAGKSFNHPLMAIWIEDLDSNYTQTLYVARSIAEGIFRHGDPSTGRWQPGPVRRPAALPYWGHQRGIKASDGLYLPTQDDPMPDAITGPTPKGSFILNTHTPAESHQKFRVLFEINQAWDWNQYWTNNKFPDDEHYKTSSQPAVVYEALIDLTSEQKSYILKPIGHSHWSGKTGKLFTDLSTLTTALDIARSIQVMVE
jgi:hypothetical protein